MSFSFLLMGNSLIGNVFIQKVPFEYQGRYPTFNWSYLADFQKIHKALGGNGINVLLRPQSANQAFSRF